MTFFFLFATKPVIILTRLLLFILLFIFFCICNFFIGYFSICINISCTILHWFVINFLLFNLWHLFYRPLIVFTFNVIFWSNTKSDSLSIVRKNVAQKSYNYLFDIPYQMLMSEYSHMYRSIWLPLSETIAIITHVILYQALDLK